MYLFVWILEPFTSSKLFEDPWRINNSWKKGKQLRYEEANFIKDKSKQYWFVEQQVAAVTFRHRKASV